MATKKKRKMKINIHESACSYLFFFPFSLYYNYDQTSRNWSICSFVLFSSLARSNSYIHLYENYREKEIFLYFYVSITIRSIYISFGLVVVKKRNWCRWGHNRNNYNACDFRVAGVMIINHCHMHARTRWKKKHKQIYT